MSRRCLCSKLIEAVRGDPRLVTLPLAARMAFILLAEAAARAPEPGAIPFTSAARVSLLVSCAETEAETLLETLETEALIRIEAGAIRVPIVAEAAARTAAARENGRNGGRPRKGESREAYLARRQAHLPLPIAGGAAAETQETEGVKAHARATTTTLPVESGCRGDVSPDPARDPYPHVALGVELEALASLDGARGGFDYRPVQAWLNAGIAAETIRDAIEARCGQPGYEPRNIRTFKYFDQVVIAAHKRLSYAPAAPKPMTAEEREADRREWDRLERMADAMQWTGGASTTFNPSIAA
jgi:hypothetical protein